jgi:hypothetical protein
VVELTRNETLLGASVSDRYVCFNSFVRGSTSHGISQQVDNPVDGDTSLGHIEQTPTQQFHTRRDRERVIEGLATGDRKADQALDQTVQQLAKRWFVVRDMHAGPTPVLLQPRYAMTYMRGPMTRSELMRAVE